jgi:hypothetical protein
MELKVFSILFTEPPVIGPFSFPSDIVDEGSFVQVTCSVVKGDEPLKITWHLQGAVVSSEPSLSTTMIGTRTSILIISQVGYRHAGLYACRAENPSGVSTYTAELRVNGTCAEGNVAGRQNQRHWKGYLLGKSFVLVFLPSHSISFQKCPQSVLSHSLIP